MPEREADRAHPDRLLAQAVDALVSDAGREISPDFRRQLRKHDAAPSLFGAKDLAAAPDSAVVVQREARLIDSANPTLAQTKLVRSLKQHQAEWSAFLGSVPQRSWVREIAGRL
jgi:hypothetical protein